jgi:3-hydroxyacyl-[acyl-carrier-protein] dehydratase
VDNIVYDAVQIQQILPHRYPFLLIDRIAEFVDNERIVGIKAVTFNEPFFQGHFPDRPVMPGVLILEAMAQTAAVLAKESSDGVAEGKYIFLVGATDVKWKRQVVPGDTLVIEMISEKKRRPIWKMKGTVRVDGKIVASALVSAMESE